MTIPYDRQRPPLDADDLAVCQDVFESVSAELEIEPDSDASVRVGRIVVHLCQEGVKDRDKLLAMVRATRGIW